MLLFTLALFSICYFGPSLGACSDSLIKYVSCYYNILIWIHVSIKSVVISNTSDINILNVVRNKPIQFSSPYKYIFLQIMYAVINF
jgi:hypothetical protein